MVLSRAYDLLKDGCSQVLNLIHPVIQPSVEYAQNHPWIALGVTIGAVFIYKYITRPRNLPPGPFNWPILGAVSCLRIDMQVKLLELRAVYGDVIYLKLFGNEMVVLNSEKAIREALVRRGDEFFQQRVIELIRDGIGPTYNEKLYPAFKTDWKDTKKIAVTALRNSGFVTARSETKSQCSLDKLETLLVDQKGRPISTKEHCKTYLAALSYLVYFDENLELDDPKLSKFMSIVDDWHRCLVEGFMLYDFLLHGFPRLRRLICHKALANTKKAQQALTTEIKKIVQAHRASIDPTNPRDFIDYYFLHHQDVSEDVVAFLIQMTLPDSFETTSLFLTWMVFYLAKYQHVQEKLKEQLEDVVGQGRKPALSDKSKLPFAEAIILETLRRTDSVPITHARDLTHDVEFGGYKIPKTAGVSACLHSVHYDPDIFPDPEKFDPSRFIDDDGKLIPTMASHVIAFGIGPRMCMGEQYIKSQLFLTLTRLTQRFSITFDPSQPEPSAKPEYTASHEKLPAPHKICFTPQ